MMPPDAYQPPELTPLPFVAFNKHLSRPLLPALDTPLEFDAAALLASYGSPLYVVSERRLREDFRDFLHAFSEPCLSTRIAYSVKTNYLPAVCAVLRDEGAWAEVVSAMEYELARSLGIPAHEIIWNGPGKTSEDLARALGDGALVNVDNFRELDDVQRIAKDHAGGVRIGLRVSFDHRHGAWTKFGFNQDNGDARRALARIARDPRLHLDMLHHHGGTFVLNTALYAEAADRLIELGKVARRLGLKPGAVDFGGGFPSCNALKPEYDLPGGSVRTGNHWFAYAEAICSRLKRSGDVFGERPTLILEPGRALVDASTQLLCTVMARKTTPGHGQAVVVDAGVNLVPTACFYDHGLSLADPACGERAAHALPVDVYGPLCMQSDKLRHRALLPSLEVGDPLVIANVGAYCHTMSMQFIQTRPATVMVGHGGTELIRRRERWRDVFRLDCLPERFRAAGDVTF